MMKSQKFYVVVGPYRSGTSLLSRIIEKLGASPGPEGELYEPTDWNPAGYIQRPDITAFNTQLIINAGGSLAEPPTPEIIAERTNPEVFKGLNLDWMLNLDNPLIKDPRFCFTLLCWIRAGVFDKHPLSLIRISRDQDSAAASALVHYDVKNYCGSSLTTAKKMISAYEAAATWHEKYIDGAWCHVKYESLIANPTDEINRLAKFMNVKEPKLIQSAIDACLEGKSKVSYDISG